MTTTTAKPRYFLLMRSGALARLDCRQGRSRLKSVASCVVALRMCNSLKVRSYRAPPPQRNRVVSSRARRNRRLLHSRIGCARLTSVASYVLVRHRKRRTTACRSSKTLNTSSSGENFGGRHSSATTGRNTNTSDRRCISRIAASYSDAQVCERSRWGVALEDPSTWRQDKSVKPK